MSEILGPSRYEVNKVLPSYMEMADGKILVKRGLIHEGGQGPFDCVTDYGFTLMDLREPTKTDFWPENVTYVGREEAKVRRAFDNLTLLAGIKDVDFKNPWFGVIYAANFTVGFREPFSSALGELDEHTTLLAPLRGGEVVHIIARTLGFRGNIPQVRESRVVLKGGVYLVGLRQIDPEVKIEDNILYADDCRAAAGSEDTLLRWAVDLNPNVQKIRSVVGVGVKRSSEILFRTWKKWDYRPLVGADANGMNDNYYLKVTEEEHAQGRFPRSCSQRVGDMGTAMDLQDPRKREILTKVIEAVASGKISANEIFQATKIVIEKPDQMEKIAAKLLAKA